MKIFSKESIKSRKKDKAQMNISKENCVPNVKQFSIKGPYVMANRPLMGGRLGVRLEVTINCYWTDDMYRKNVKQNECINVLTKKYTYIAV